MTSSFGLEIAASNKFPGKLWRMVNTCASGAIGWGMGGQSVIINQTKFQHEFLDPPNCIFKTTNIESFIRQLNLYGFRKLGTTKSAGQNESQIHEFQNENFIRGRPDLLPLLQRNVGMRRRQEAAVKRKIETAFELNSSSKRGSYSDFYDYSSIGSSLTSPSNSPAGSDTNNMELHSKPDSSSLMSIFPVPSHTKDSRTVQLPVLLEWDTQLQTYMLRVLPEQAPASDDSGLGSFNDSGDLQSFSRDLPRDVFDTTDDHRRPVCDDSDDIDLKPKKDHTSHNGSVKSHQEFGDHISFPLVQGLENIRPGEYYLFGLMPERDSSPRPSPSPPSLHHEQTQLQHHLQHPPLQQHSAHHLSHTEHHADDFMDLSQLDLSDLSMNSKPSVDNFDYIDLDSSSSQDLSSTCLKATDALLGGMDDSLNSLDPTLSRAESDVISGSPADSVRSLCDVPDVNDLFRALESAKDL